MVELPSVWFVNKNSRKSGILVAFQSQTGGVEAGFGNVKSGFYL